MSKKTKVSFLPHTAESAGDPEPSFPALEKASKTLIKAQKDAQKAENAFNQLNAKKTDLFLKTQLHTIELFPEHPLTMERKVEIAAAKAAFRQWELDKALLEEKMRSAVASVKIHQARYNQEKQRSDEIYRAWQKRDAARRAQKIEVKMLTDEEIQNLRNPPVSTAPPSPVLNSVDRAADLMKEWFAMGAEPEPVSVPVAVVPPTPPAAPEKPGFAAADYFTDEEEFETYNLFKGFLNGPKQTFEEPVQSSATEPVGPIITESDNEEKHDAEERRRTLAKKAKKRQREEILQEQNKDESEFSGEEGGEEDQELTPGEDEFVQEHTTEGDDEIQLTNSLIATGLMSLLESVSEPVTVCIAMLMAAYQRIYKQNAGRDVIPRDLYEKRVADNFWSLAENQPHLATENVAQFFRVLQKDPAAVAVREDDAPIVAPVPVKKKRTQKLKYDLNPNGDGPWAAVCREAAKTWTARLKAWKKEGTVPESGWNGKDITPAQWDRGGDNAWLYKKMGPDRRSKYQIFTRQQRKERELKLVHGRASELKRELEDKKDDIVPIPEKSIYDLLDWQLSTPDVAFLDKRFLRPLLRKDDMMRSLHAWSLIASIMFCAHLGLSYSQVALDDAWRSIFYLVYTKSKIHPGFSDTQWDSIKKKVPSDKSVIEFMRTDGKEGWGTGVGYENERPDDTRPKVRKNKKNYNVAFSMIYTFLCLMTMAMGALVDHYIADDSKKMYYKKRADGAERLLLEFAEKDPRARFTKKTIDDFRQNITKMCNQAVLQWIE